MIKTTDDFHKMRLSEGETVGLINLGCARNLVDSQAILGQVKRDGHRIVDIQQADVAIVNTCAFIDEAKQESLDTIVDLLEMKAQGKLKKVVVAGCLAQRYKDELAEEFKDIDTILGVRKLDRNRIPEQVYLTPGHTKYVKICESCYNQCSFCIIPKIKGKFNSRTVESVLEEVQTLDAAGTKEINLIGQDITAYGMDIYRELSLAKLLREMTKACRNIEWIRLLYAFPAHVTDELIETIAAEEKICNYIDIPLQHISDHILKSMNRNITTDGTRRLIEKFRERIPGVSLRTTFIVGLPGETDEDFEELLEFVKTYRFEKAGAFLYSREEGTAAYGMEGQVPDKIKRERLKRLMELQQDISRDLHEEFAGKTLKVMIDEEEKNDHASFIARTEYDAPEVDGVCYVKSEKPLKPGDMLPVTVTDTLEYDLIARPA